MKLTSLRTAPDFGCCPEAGCREPAEIIDRFAMDSTDGPIVHIKTRCSTGHWFTVPVGSSVRAAR
jgi:hypothetical protein